MEGTKAGEEKAGVGKKIARKLLEVLGEIPKSAEGQAPSPHDRARAIVTKACWKTGAISGGLAIPPGPLGIATILPDLVVMWRVQAQMVADIAAVYGKTAVLTTETMLYCLFRHFAGHVVKEVVSRAGERFVVRRGTVRMVESMMERIGLKMTQRVLGESISRWVPVVGAVAIGAYSYYDTAKVGGSAIELFKTSELPAGEEEESEEGEG